MDFDPTMIVTERPPYVPFLDPRLSRLPGVVPVADADWIVVPDDTNAQLAHRDDLIATRRDKVLGMTSEGQTPVLELLDLLVEHVGTRPEWQVEGDRVTRPDGQVIDVDRTDPLCTIGRLVSEDFCIMIRPEGASEYVLAGAALCFPAGWALAEKIGRPMTDIHGPVPHYDADLAKRVNRIFDAIRSEQILMRFNWSLPAHAELFAPPEIVERLDTPEDSPRHFLRVERQTLRRLPHSGAVVFGIRTTLSPLASLTKDEAGIFLKILQNQRADVIDYKEGFEHLEHAMRCLSERATA